MSAGADRPDPADLIVANGVDVEDLAVTEFYLRARIASPLKSWFKSSELVEPCQFTRSTEAGIAIASIAEDPTSELEIERRPGYRRTAVEVRRRDEEREERRWWVESGERVVNEEGSA